MDEIKEQSGLVRRIEPIQPIPNPKTGEPSGWYQREIVFDSGQTYPLRSQSLDFLDVDHILGLEVKFSVNEKGSLILHGIPPRPKRTVPKPKPLEGNSREKYWENKDDWDTYNRAVQERQFWITFVQNFAIPLAKLSESNWEEVAPKTAEIGITLHEKYGKYKFD